MANNMFTYEIRCVSHEDPSESFRFTREGSASGPIEAITQAMAEIKEFEGYVAWELECYFGNHCFYALDSNQIYTDLYMKTGYVG